MRKERRPQLYIPWLVNSYAHIFRFKMKDYQPELPQYTSLTFLNLKHIFVGFYRVSAVLLSYNYSHAEFNYLVHFLTHKNTISQFTFGCLFKVSCSVSVIWCMFNRGQMAPRDASHAAGLQPAHIPLSSLPQSCCLVILSFKIGFIYKTMI